MLQTTQKNHGIGFMCSVWLTVLGMQLTDIKIGSIKVMEIMFLLVGVRYLQSMHWITKKFFIFFVVFLLITFFHNIFLEFGNIPNTSFLKTPYWVSIGRFVEMLAVFSFVEYVRTKMKAYGWQEIVNKVITCNFYFSFIILGLYALQLTGHTVIPVASERNLRLTGFYVEGGPLGLLYSVLLILSIRMKKSLPMIIIFASVIVFAQSKAGLTSCVAYFLFNPVNKLYMNKCYRKYVYIVGGCLLSIFMYIFAIIAKKYIDSSSDTAVLATYVAMNPYDYSTVAGRISGSYIVPEMFKAHPLIGIGIGNYPLLRNNNEYRLFFPSVDIWDAPGLGGFVDILNQCGLIGLILFLHILLKLNKLQIDKVYLILFCLPLTFGVQYTFMYPWLMIAIVIAMYEDTKRNTRA